MVHVALVGLGPHARRIYLHYFKKFSIHLALLVELESKKDSVSTYLREQTFSSTHLFTINDFEKDNKHLSKDTENRLLQTCRNLHITHLIIATEPKGHYMYLEFSLKYNIHVLTDKPITVTKNMTKLKNVNAVRKEYYELLTMAKHSKAQCKVMCQRQYHKGYEKIKKILTEVVDTYKIPITHIDIFHSDGAFELPHDLDKENHPYKYGYGKLYHSGYHFIDLLSDFLKINDSLGKRKKIVKGDVYSTIVTPNDEVQIFSIEDYKRLFKGQNIPTYYDENKKPTFDFYGEKDYHGLFTFYNKEGFTLTTASLNLLHNGVSRRSWIETKDFYKNNGRIRHEHINIEIGHLMNIQVHSYQSKEIGDRTEKEDTVGGLEHFDIYIFSNPLLHREPLSKIQLKDLYAKEETKEFLGYNELARETFLTNFLHNTECRGDIKEQALAIEILYACSKEITNYYIKKKHIEQINIRNTYTYPYLVKRLKVYSHPVDRHLNKIDIKGNIYTKDIYTIYNFLKYIPDKKYYEVFISIQDTKNVAGSLLDKTFKSKVLAYLYYKFLDIIIKYKSISYLEVMIEK